jgi:plasmid stabilization system protein ParE
VKPLAVIYSKQARQDIHSIFDYIQLFRPQAAEHFIERLDRVVERVAHLPRSGPLPRDKRLRTLGYRYAVVDEYLLFYRCSRISVAILRMVHGRRHYVPLLLSKK